MFSPLRGSPRRLRLLVIGVYLAGITCMLIAALLATTAHDDPGGARLVLAGVIVAAGELAVMHLRFGGERYTFTWSEAAVVLGIVLLPFPYLVLVAPLAVAMTHGLSGRVPMKVLYNAMSAAVAVMVARLAAGATYGALDLDDGTGWRFWAGLVVAAVAFSIINFMFTAAAVAFSQNMSLRAVWGRGLNATLGVLAGNTLVALLLVQISWNAATILMLPALLGLLYTAYRGYLSAREDRDTWRELEAASKELVTLDVSRVAKVAAERALRLARADEVELFVRGPEGNMDRYHGDRKGTVVCDEDVTPSLELLDLHGGLVRSSHEADDGSSSSHALTMPLEDAENGMPLGALRLWFRSDVRLSDRERQVLVTFGRSAAASLCNARMYERAQHAAKVHEHEATHDSLTGLPNRALLRRRVAEVLAEPEATVSLLLVDLDHFKSINDTLGHPTGDRLLQAAARRLSTVVRSTDTIARLGGDEFAILLPGLASPDDADVVAKALIDALATPVIVDGLRLSVEGSIGISHFPYDAGSVDDLLSHADIALYQAKTARGSFRHYSKDRDDSSVSRLTLAAELRGALARDELVLHFQPQYRVLDGELIGAEALVRWAHPQRGLLPPSEFISLAEDSGLAHEFTLHVLSKAIQEAATWRDLGSDAHVAVNLSARNLLDPELATAVEAALLRHRLPASRLVLEITERTVMSELDVVERVLGELRALGVQLSVDDFGTGYSSMAFLTRSSVNELKVDRGFVSNMVTSDSDAAIVRATIELAHGLGLRVVAEGVEDEETWQALCSLGCDSAQGFYLARPLVVEQLRQRMLSSAATAQIAQQRRSSDGAVVALHRR